jgi:hypothetical protein
VVSLSFDAWDWIEASQKLKTILSLTYIIRKFIEYDNSQSQTYEDTLQELIRTLKRESFFLGPLIGDLSESHHALKEDSIKDPRPHDENDTMVVPPFIDDGELEQCEDLS